MTTKKTLLIFVLLMNLLTIQGAYSQSSGPGEDETYDNPGWITGLRFNGWPTGVLDQGNFAVGFKHVSLHATPTWGTTLEFQTQLYREEHPSRTCYRCNDAQRNVVLPMQAKLVIPVNNDATDEERAVIIEEIRAAAYRMDFASENTSAIGLVLDFAEYGYSNLLESRGFKTHDVNFIRAKEILAIDFDDDQNVALYINIEAGLGISYVQRDEDSNIAIERADGYLRQNEVHFNVESNLSLGLTFLDNRLTVVAIGGVHSRCNQGRRYIDPRSGQITWRRKTDVENDEREIVETYDNIINRASGCLNMYTYGASISGKLWRSKKGRVGLNAGVSYTETRIQQTGSFDALPVRNVEGFFEIKF